MITYLELLKGMQRIKKKMFLLGFLDKHLPGFALRDSLFFQNYLMYNRYLPYITNKKIKLHYAKKFGYLGPIHFGAVMDPRYLYKVSVLDQVSKRTEFYYPNGLLKTDSFAFKYKYSFDLNKKVVKTLKKLGSFSFTIVRTCTTKDFFAYMYERDPEFFHKNIFYVEFEPLSIILFVKEKFEEYIRLERILPEFGSYKQLNERKIQVNCQ